MQLHHAPTLLLVSASAMLGFAASGALCVYWHSETRRATRRAARALASALAMWERTGADHSRVRDLRILADRLVAALG